VLVRWLVITACAVAGAATLLGRPAALLHQATGSAAQYICSKGFLSGLQPADVLRDHLLPEPGMALIAWALSYDVDRVRREVRARVFGGFEARSAFREGRGCTLIYSGYPEPKDLSPVPDIEREAGALSSPNIVKPREPRLRAALDRAFSEPSEDPPRNTQAVVIVHAGRIIAERYARGVGPDTPLLSHSIAKSVVSTLVGILVRDGKLRLDAPAPVSEWGNDERRSITIEQLLRMSAGFGFDEGGGPSIATSIWFTEPDTATVSAEATLRHAPGSTWGYCSRCYMVLSRIIGEVVGRGPQGVRDFAQRELFGPLGMERVTLEFDAMGTLMGAHAMFATARDFARLGLLYLNGGVVGRRRILPADWAAFVTRPTAQGGYGAGFWLNTTAAKVPEWGIHWGLSGTPRDAFMARGYLGQYIVVVPSADLVVVRMGQSHGREAEIASVGEIVRETIATLGAHQ
jgi:CubicO group peptidase (beta-lactamase class C family)